MKDEPYLTPKQRRQRNRQQVIENILSIAREMMQADGVAALRFNAIARRLGMQPPSLYNYFPSKHAIYDALFRTGFEMLGETMRNAERQPGSPDEQLRRGVRAFMTFAQENQDLYQLMMQRPVPGFVPSEESMAVSLGQLQASYEWIGQLIRGSDLQPGMPVEQAADLFFALVNGLTDLHLANNPDLPAGQGRFGSLVDRAVELVLAAWRPEK